MRRDVVLLACALLFAACGDVRRTESERAAPSDLLVRADMLPRETGDVVLLHIAPDSAAHLEAAIPGAAFVPLSAVAVERDGNINEFPAPAAMRATFEAAGVGDSTRVILYGEPLHAARAFAALDLLGHSRTGLLDGGHAAWEAAGAPVFAGAPSPGARITSAPRPDLVVDADRVLQLLDGDGVVLLDARPEDSYAEGHLPRAASIFWERTLVSSADPRLLPQDELRALFEATGAFDADHVVVYCRTGMQASFLYFVARHLGLDVRLYDGSYADWTARALPVAR